jgi:hypothetical protein
MLQKIGLVKIKINKMAEIQWKEYLKLGNIRLIRNKMC